MGFFGIEIGPSIDSLANDWINQYAIHPDLWQGTLADLNSYISQSADICGTYVHVQNGLHNKPNGTNACEAKLRSRYAQQLLPLQGENQAFLSGLKKGGNTNLYIIAAVVIAALLIIVLIIKK
jgi:hypothetical protein